MWLMGIIRTLFIILDSVVFWAVEKVYSLFTMISQTGVFTPETIRTFAGRIYVLLGVFMLFKVSFSLITYILNPDTLTDKNKGMGGLVKRTIVVLVGIIAVPYVFQAAYSLQAIILKDNIIGSIILGREASNLDIEDGDYIEQGGKIMSHTVFTSFIRLNPKVVGKTCANNPIIKDENGYSLNSRCSNSVFDMDVNNKYTLGELLVESYEERDAGLLLDIDVIMLKSEAGSGNGKVDWVFDYTLVFSTLTGGLLAWILLLFCIDVGVRSVKLGFLQLVAPIPIISYVDPKGEKVFQKWLGECGKTYLDLFVRLIAIYFVVYIVVILETTNTYNLITGETQDNFLVKLFIILGALMFAKQLPDLISNILGIKLSGGFTLNPMNKIQQVPLAGAAATNLLGRTAGAWEAIAHDQTGNKWRAAASGWFAAGSALHGKVPLMGAKPGSATVRSIHTGREAGFEVATGSKMRTHSLVNDMLRGTGEREIQNLKDNYKKPLQKEINDVALQKQEVANAYNKLSERYQQETNEETKKAIYEKMMEAQTRYQDLTKYEGELNGNLGVINDQIKDLEKAYNIDKSPVEELDKVKTKVDSGTHHKEFSPLDLNIPNTNSASANGHNSSDTVGGVKVTQNSNGEKTTESGIILGSNIDFDK